VETRAGGPGPPAPFAPSSSDPGNGRSLPALLLAQAAAQREQPWLFVQRGLDWRWRSFGAVAARVERLRSALTEALAGLPPAGASGGAARRIGFEDDGGPEAVALDLAIQAAGACAAPLPPGLAEEALASALAERGCAALARLDAGAGATPRAAPAEPPTATFSAGAGESAAPAPTQDRAPVFHLPGDEPPGGSIAPPAPPWGGGSVLVTWEGRWKEVSQSELIAGVEDLGARLAPPKPPRRSRRPAAIRRSARPEREVLVLPRPLADPAGRRLAAWALAAGAALVLEPDRALLAATAAWVRPTVFAGDPAEIAALRAEVEARRRRRGLPFGRLHTVAVLGGEALPAAERAFWAGRGAAVSVV
jgi:hypothetical protein